MFVKKLLFLIAFLIFINFDYCSSQAWKPLGPDDAYQIKATGGGFTSLAFDASGTYVACFGDDNIQYNTLVVKHLNSAGTWDVVGNPILCDLNTPTTNVSIAFNGGTLYFSCCDGNYSQRATVRKLNASNVWEIVGTPGFSAGRSDYLSMAFNGSTPYVAFQDMGNGSKLTVMKLNSAGTDWENVGNAGFSSGKASQITLAFIGSVPYVGYFDEGVNNYSKVVRLNGAGTGWENVGSAVSSSYTAMAVDGSKPYLVFGGTSSTAMTIKKLNDAGSDWQTVGNAGFFTGLAINIQLKFNGNTPYVAFDDYNNSSKLCVMKLNSTGSTWENVGKPDFSSGYASFISLAFNNNNKPFIAFSDAGYLGKIRLFQLNSVSTDWEQVGTSGFSAGSANYINIVMSGTTPYVAYRDQGHNYSATVKKYNAATAAWETVGMEGFSGPDVSNVALTFNGTTPYVALGGSQARVMKLNTASTAWENVGNTNFSTGLVGDFLPIAFSGSTPYVAFSDSYKSYKVSVMRLNTSGTTWETVGPEGFGTATGGQSYVSLAMSGATPYVAFQDANNGGKATVMKLNTVGTAWQVVGKVGITTGIARNISLVFNNSVLYMLCTQTTSAAPSLYKLNAAGTDWTQIPVNAAPLASSLPYADNASLTFVGSTPYISYSGSNNDLQTNVIKLNASGNYWDYVGVPSISKGEGYYNSITSLNSVLYLAYDGSGAFVRTYDLNNNITSISPASAQTGATVTITGSGFTGVTAVAFGGIAARSFTVNSATSITAVVGNGASGNVTVTTGAGSLSIAGFTYIVVPSVTAFTPNTGVKGTAVTITGANFNGATSVTFGGTPASSFIVNSSGSITAIVGSGSSGSVSVTAPSGVGSLGNFQFVPVPTISVSGQTTFLSGGKATLTVNEAGAAYQWIKDGVVIPGATNTTYIANQSGSYKVTITINGISQTSSQTVILTALPSNNFTVKSTSITCKGAANGSISITATQSLNYTTTITGNGLNKTAAFTGSTSFNNLTAGTYNICITLASQASDQQCYTMVITEPKDISLYSVVSTDSKTITLLLGGGSIYNIQLNGSLHSTKDSIITLPVIAGRNDLIITSDKPCQGVIEKVFTVSDVLTAYPNPFEKIIYLNIGNQTIANARVEVYSTMGALVYKNQFGNPSNTIQLDLSGIKLPGTYTIKLTADGSQQVFKIIKK